MVLQGPQEHTFAQYACHRLDSVFRAALQSSLNVITDLNVHFYRTTGRIVNIFQLLHKDTLFSAITAYVTDLLLVITICNDKKSSPLEALNCVHYAGLNLGWNSIIKRSYSIYEVVMVTSSSFPVTNSII
jgi:hypothetical protein